MQPLIGLTGYAGSGKDTASEALVARGWTRVAFADPVREMALAIDPLIEEGLRLSEIVRLCGWDSAKTDREVRRLLQAIGTEAGRLVLGEDVWINLAAEAIDEIDGPVVITDCRFDDEAHFIRCRGGIVVRVRRPSVGAVNSHVSEGGVDEALVDYVLINDFDIGQLHEGILTIADSEFPD